VTENNPITPQFTSAAYCYNGRGSFVHSIFIIFDYISSLLL